MSSISDIQHAGIRNVLSNMTLSAPILAINAASAATVKTTSPIVASFAGVSKSKAALAAQSIAVTHDAFGAAVASGYAAYVQPASTRVVYVLSVNAAGAVAVSQGTYAGQVLTTTRDLSKVLNGTGGVPLEPVGYTAFGAIVVTTGGAVTFTPGTTALDAAGVTAAYTDISILPASL